MNSECKSSIESIKYYQSELSRLWLDTNSGEGLYEKLKKERDKARDLVLESTDTLDLGWNDWFTDYESLRSQSKFINLYQVLCNHEITEVHINEVDNVKTTKLVCASCGHIIEENYKQKTI